MSKGTNMSEEKVKFRNFIMELDSFKCQNCDKEISEEEQKDSIASYFAKKFDEYYCAKCANDRHEYLIAKHVN